MFLHIRRPIAIAIIILKIFTPVNRGLLFVNIVLSIIELLTIGNDFSQVV